MYIFKIIISNIFYWFDPQNISNNYPIADKSDINIILSHTLKRVKN